MDAIADKTASEIGIPEPAPFTIKDVCWRIANNTCYQEGHEIEALGIDVYCVKCGLTLKELRGEI